MMRRFGRLLSLASAVTPVAASAYIPLIQIQFFDVSSGMDINNRQEVVGATSSSLDFVWSQIGGLRRLGTNANLGINESGWICGALGTGTSARGFVYRFGIGTIQIDVDPRGGYSEIAVGLNDSGTVIGNLFAPNSLNNGAFFWQEPNILSIIPPLPGDTFFKARDISSAGIIVGQSFRLGFPATATAYVPGIGTQPLAGNDAIAINDHGDYITNVNGVPKLYNLTAGFIRDIPDLPAQDINNNGYVITANSVIRPDGTLVQARSLIQGYPDWEFLLVRINDNNEIVGRMAPKSGGASSPFVLSLALTK